MRAKRFLPVVETFGRRRSPDRARAGIPTSVKGSVQSSNIPNQKTKMGRTFVLSGFGVCVWGGGAPKILNQPEGKFRTRTWCEDTTLVAASV